jgi:hypothetical protein
MTLRATLCHSSCRRFRADPSTRNRERAPDFPVLLRRTTHKTVPPLFCSRGLLMAPVLLPARPPKRACLEAQRPVQAQPVGSMPDQWGRELVGTQSARRHHDQVVILIQASVRKRTRGKSRN